MTMHIDDVSNSIIPTITTTVGEISHVEDTSINCPGTRPPQPLSGGSQGEQHTGQPALPPEGMSCIQPSWEGT